MLVPLFSRMALPTCSGSPMDSSPTYAGHRSIYYVPKHRKFLERTASWAENICFLFPDIQASGEAGDGNGNWRERICYISAPKASWRSVAGNSGDGIILTP